MFHQKSFQLLTYELRHVIHFVLLNPSPLLCIRFIRVPSYVAPQIVITSMIAVLSNYPGLDFGIEALFERYKATTHLQGLVCDYFFGSVILVNQRSFNWRLYNASLASPSTMSFEGASSSNISKLRVGVWILRARIIFLIALLCSIFGHYTSALFVSAGFTMTWYI